MTEIQEKETGLEPPKEKTSLNEEATTTDQEVSVSLNQDDSIMMVTTTFVNNQVTYKAYLGEAAFKKDYPTVHYFSGKHEFGENKIELRILRVNQFTGDDLWYGVGYYSGKAVNFMCFESIEEALNKYPDLEKKEDGSYVSGDLKSKGIAVLEVELIR